MSFCSVKNTKFHILEHSLFSSRFWLHRIRGSGIQYELKVFYQIRIYELDERLFRVRIMN